MEKPGILSISRSESKEIEPSGVVFNVTVEGEKYLLGNAALEKSQVLHNLVVGLKAMGAEDKDFQVKGVTSKTSGGVFGSNTKAVYRLAIELEDLKKIGEYLGFISSQGSAMGCDLEWRFKETAVADELSTKALVAAKSAAEQMAEAIGFRVVGIKRCTDGMAEQHFAYPAPQVMGGMVRDRAMSQEIDIGTDFKATRTVTRWVNVDFLISPNA